MNFGMARCLCQHCSGWLEFQRNQIGQYAACPHCNLETLLYEAPSIETINEQERVQTVLAERAVQNKNRKRWLAASAIPGLILIVIGIWKLSQYETGQIFLEFIWGGFLLFCAGTVYFIPAIVGRKKANFTAIFVLNFFLGWTLLGWVIALVWACTIEKEKI